MKNTKTFLFLVLTGVLVSGIAFAATLQSEVQSSVNANAHGNVQSGSAGEGTSIYGEQSSSGDVSGILQDGGNVSITPVANGGCGKMSIESTDGTRCLKVSAFSTSETSAAALGGDATISAGEGEASSAVAGSVSIAASIPTIVISPAAMANTSITFDNSEKTMVSDGTANGELSIAPAGGLKVVVENAKPVTIEKSATDGTVTVSSGNVTSSVGTDDRLKVEGGKLSLSGQAVIVMPDAAVLAAREKLNSAATVQSVELKSANVEGQTTASYEVTAVREAKILGVINVAVPVTANVNAETGTVTSVGEPWWSFVAF